MEAQAGSCYRDFIRSGNHAPATPVFLLRFIAFHVLRCWRIPRFSTPLCLGSRR